MRLLWSESQILSIQEALQGAAGIVRVWVCTTKSEPRVDQLVELMQRPELDVYTSYYEEGPGETKPDLVVYVEAQTGGRPDPSAAHLEDLKNRYGR